MNSPRCLVFLMSASLAVQACAKTPPPVQAVTPTATSDPSLSPGMKRPYALPLNNPPFVPAAQAEHMDPSDWVVGVVVAGQARAYPWWLVTNYHTVNDTIMTTAEEVDRIAPQMHQALERQRQRSIKKQLEIGVDMSKSTWADQYVPIVVTICEKCTAAAAFIPVVQDREDFAGQPLVFSVCASKPPTPGDYKAVGIWTMCDAQTHSRWHPLAGFAGSGTLEGRRLQRVHAFNTTWQSWVRRFPDTVVAYGAREELTSRTHAVREQRSGGGLHRSFTWWLREGKGKADDRLPQTDLVLGVAHGQENVAVPLRYLREKGGLLNIEVAGEPYLLVLQESVMAVAYSRRLGNEVLTFTASPGDKEESWTFDDHRGTTWNILGQAITGDSKNAALSLAQVAYVVYWAEWVTTHPNTKLLSEIE
jgi:hypothetical protein